LVLAAGCDVADPFDYEVTGDNPDFDLNEITAGGGLGDRVKLSSLGGKVVVLDFWASYCAPCLGAMGHFHELAREFERSGVVILSVNIEGAAQTSAVKWQHYQRPIAGGLSPTPASNIKLLAGADPVAEAYGVESLPSIVILDRNGDSVARHDQSVSREVLRGNITTALAR
jgi:thiol-disulfide isomerase/thioredoxin